MAGVALLAEYCGLSAIPACMGVAEKKMVKGNAVQYSFSKSCGDVSGSVQVPVDAGQAAHQAALRSVAAAACGRFLQSKGHADGPAQAARVLAAGGTLEEELAQLRALVEDAKAPAAQARAATIARGHLREKGAGCGVCDNPFLWGERRLGHDGSDITRVLDGKVVVLNGVNALCGRWYGLERVLTAVLTRTQLLPGVQLDE